MEGVLEVDGIMMMAGVRNHADGDHEGCDDSATYDGDQDHGEEGLGEDDEEAWEDDENYECHAVACEDDECHGEACEDEDDPHDEGLEELVDGDHDEVDGERGVEDDDHDVVDGDHGDLDGHKDQGVHMVQDDDDGEGWP